MYHIYTIFIYFGYGANMGTITKRTNPSGAISYRAQVRIKKEGYPSFSESRTFSKRSLAAEWIKKREAEIELNPSLCSTCTKPVKQKGGFTAFSYVC